MTAARSQLLDTQRQGLLDSFGTCTRLLTAESRRIVLQSVCGKMRCAYMDLHGRMRRSREGVVAVESRIDEQVYAIAGVIVLI